ncbi:MULTISPECIES: hypothetical protein [Bacillus]|uniref:hypothetical protein n=1 Tax=Bacillus TaxID=1386 RepID=UPI001596898D|nr:MULTISPECIES: hypothetical protein [Bacillus]
MTSPELTNFIQLHTYFVTELEEIIDIILERQNIYFYDTSSISIHEKAYFQHNETLFFELY